MRNKSIIFLLIFFLSFSSTHAIKIDHQFINIGSYDSYKELGIFTYMNSQLKNGYIFFPKNVAVEKKKHILFLCEREKKGELLSIYCANSLKMSSPIPKESDIISLLKEQLGEKTFQKLSQKGENNTIQKIKVYGEDFIQEKTDIFHTETYKITSEKNQNISIKIFPITDKSYDFDSYSEVEFDKEGFKNPYPYLTIFPASFDYYNISVENYSLTDTQVKNYPNSTKQDPLVIFPTSGTFVEKKYKLTTFKWKSIFSENIFYKRTLVPYYEYSVPVIKGKNTIVINYQTASLRDQNQEIYLGL